MIGAELERSRTFCRPGTQPRPATARRRPSSHSSTAAERDSCGAEPRPHDQGPRLKRLVEAGGNFLFYLTLIFRSVMCPGEAAT